jgi:DNA-binding IclR family transcriptional regulator
MGLLGLKLSVVSTASQERPLSALSKGFRILGAVAAEKSGLTFSEIVHATGIPKASVHRLLREMVDLAVLSYDEATRSYQGGLMLASLGASVTANYDVRRVVRPHLEALHDATKNVVTLGIRDGERGIYIDKIEPANLMIRLHSEIGKSFPLHCTAMGKVLLAHSEPGTIGRVTRRKLERYTDSTITDGKILRDELDKVTSDGFAIDREEITRGLVCIAAPVHGVDGRVDAAVSCTMSSFDVSASTLDAVADHVMRCARAASGSAG